MDLGNGREIAQARTAVYTAMVAHWAEQQLLEFGYDRPFAVAALGGTGRGEMAPCSDTDFVFLFDDVIEGNRFLLELQRQVLHSDEFERKYGFGFEPLPFSLEDVPRLEGMQLNAFIDVAPVFDPDGLTARFRERIRASYDPFEHFLHVQQFWKGRWERAAEESERLDRFDIKNDGLRVFLAGIWTLAGKTFQHSHEVYRTLEDPRDLEAYYFLLRVRAFIHDRRGTHRRPTATGEHVEDVLGFDDFTCFGELAGPDVGERLRFEFANDVRARLLSARRRVSRFTQGIIGRELRAGRERRPGSPIVFGTGGLRHTRPEAVAGTRERSRAAFSLLQLAQRHGLPIDRSELEGIFRNASDWLEAVPELGALFYDRRGSIADTFDFLSKLDGVEERLFPGYAKFEVSLDGRILRERRSMRGALVQSKLRALEQLVKRGDETLSGAVRSRGPADPGQELSVAVEAALLDADHLAAVRLALKTKRLPLTPADRRIRDDTNLPLYERLSTGFSGIPVDAYFSRCLAACEFSAETLRAATFLVTHRRAFKERSNAPNDRRQVLDFVALCQTESLLRALFVFTHADHTEWESEGDDPARWFNTRELYLKSLAEFRPGFDPARSLNAAGYSVEERAILGDFGEDFFSGVYRRHANRFGAHLVHLAQDPMFSAPKVTVLREGAGTILGIAARDYRGLAASIMGALRHHGLSVRQAHLFSATNQGLALDFFHLAAGGKSVTPEMVRAIEQAIARRTHLISTDAAHLGQVARAITLEEWRPNLFCLRAQTAADVGTLIHALTYAVFQHLGGDVFGLSAHSGRDGAWVTVYHSLPPGTSLEMARAILARFT